MHEGFQIKSNGVQTKSKISTVIPFSVFIGLNRNYEKFQTIK